MADNPPWYEKGKALTKQFEGFRSAPYLDTKGIPTVGYGFNLAAHPNLPRNMSRQQADQIFDGFYNQAAQTAQNFAGDRWTKLGDNQKATLTDMAYNLHNKLFGFQNMQKNLMQGNDAGVQQQMQNSKWYGQVGNRGKADVAAWGQDTTPMAAPDLSNVRNSPMGQGNQ